MPTATITANNVNLRSGPGTNFQILGQVHTGASGAVLETQRECTAEEFQWYRVQFAPDGREAWVRGTYVRLGDPRLAAASGASGSITIGPVTSAPVTWARWDPPVTPHSYTITNTHENERHHDGLDFSCPRGTLVRCGPLGGVAVKVFACYACQASGDGAISLNDPRKGYGYGSYVIVAYAYDRLPSTIKAVVPPGAWVFAMHAHLSHVNVSPGDQLAPNQVIGLVGATGNTYGSPPDHLHLALRVGPNPNQSWDSLSADRLDPDLMFNA